MTIKEAAAAPKANKKAETGQQSKKEEEPRSLWRMYGRIFRLIIKRVPPNAVGKIVVTTDLLNLLIRR